MSEPKVTERSPKLGAAAREMWDMARSGDLPEWVEAVERFAAEIVAEYEAAALRGAPHE